MLNQLAAAYWRDDFLVLGFGTNVARLVVKYDKEVRDLKEQGFLLGFLNRKFGPTQNSCEDPCRAQSVSPASRVPHTALSSQVSGLLYPSPRQSLELKTGVSNHSLGLLITARLRTRSPAADSVLPRPLLHTQHPQILLHLHCGEHPDRLHHRLVWKQHRWFFCTVWSTLSRISLTKGTCAVTIKVI